MRWIFALLLIANVGLFAATQLSPNKAGTEPMAEHGAVHADQIRLLSDQEAQRQPVLPPTPSAPALTCVEWGLLSEDDVARARSALQPLQLGEGDLTVRKAPEKGSSYWVYIPPLKSKQDANKKVEELKRLGVPDSFVMQENNKWHYAVSLGLFSSEEGASKYLAQLRSKGVKSAVVAARGQDGPRSSLLLTLRRENQEPAITKLLPDFPGSELKAVSCGQ